jgi:hypothetical protein
MRTRKSKQKANQKSKQKARSGQKIKKNCINTENGTKKAVLAQVD